MDLFKNDKKKGPHSVLQLEFLCGVMLMQLHTLGQASTLKQLYTVKPVLANRISSH